jgi:lipopolysaccharide/colanic/teichoic acid biosynthesis glycosyltransferase
MFCCVLFKFGGPAHGARHLQRLGSLIIGRARVTDAVGWYDATAICALLPQTDEAGARLFGAEILRLASEQELFPSATVYSFHESSSRTGGGGINHRTSLEDFDCTLRNPPEESSVVSDTLRAYELPVLPISKLFVKRLTWIKRAIDIVGSAFGLLLTLPFLMIAALAVKATSKGPVIFTQQRAGLGGRPFKLYKIRSMFVDAEARKASLAHLSEQDGPAFKLVNDPRVTTVGRILRKTSIDELPQLFNVLKGDMSLVGPRPPTLDEVDKYRLWYRRRLDVTPGITCTWQVYGRARVAFEQWMRMDIQYIKNYGTWRDLKVILATVPAVLSRRGAH